MSHPSVMLGDLVALWPKLDDFESSYNYDQATRSFQLLTLLSVLAKTRQRITSWHRRFVGSQSHPLGILLHSRGTPLSSASVFYVDTPSSKPLLHLLIVLASTERNHALF